MGCFDEVSFACPGCGARLDVQSKAGRCEMVVYRAEEGVPAEIAADIEGAGAHCAACDRHVTLRNPFGPMVRMFPSIK